MNYWPRLLFIPLPTLFLFVESIGKPVLYFFQFFAQVPYNFWIWPLIIAAPILVFSAKPESSLHWSVNRLLLAIGLTYVFLNVWLHADIALAWKAHEACKLKYSGHSGPYETNLYERMMKICPSAPNSGPPEIFYMFLGWIPATGYVGLYEFIWRWRYRRAIREKGKEFRGRWASNIVLTIATPVLLYALLILGVIIYEHVYPYSLHR